MQRHAPHQSPIGPYRQRHGAYQERQPHRILPIPLSPLAKPLVLALLASTVLLIRRHVLPARQTLHFFCRQLCEARLAHRRMKQAGVLADDLAVVGIELAQHAGDRAFHDFQVLAIKAGQIHHQPGALAEFQ